MFWHVTALRMHGASEDGNYTCVLVLNSKDRYFRDVLETGTDKVISEAKFSQLVF